MRHALLLAPLLLASFALAQADGPRDAREDADALLRAGEPAHGRTALMNAGDQHPGEGTIRFDLGILELQWLDDPAAAAFHFTTLSSDDPRYDALHNQGVAHAQAGAHDAAVVALQAALEQPAAPAAHLATRDLLGDVYYAAERYGEAAATYRALAEDSGEAMDRYQELMARAAAGEGAPLVRDLERLEAEVGSGAARLLAEIYLAADMPSYARHEYTRARETALRETDFGAFARASLNLADLEVQAGEMERALRTLEDVDLVDDDPAIAYGRAVILLALGRADEARATIAAALPPDDPATLRDTEPALLLGALIAHYAAGDPSSTLAYHREVERRRDGPDIYGLSGRLPRIAAIAAADTLARSGRGEEARALAARIDDETLTPAERVELGSLHYRAGRYDEAALQFAQARAAADAPPAVRTIATRRAAYAAQAAGRLEDAEALFEQHLAAAPFDLDAQRNYGWVLAAQGRIDNARSVWRDASGAGDVGSREALAEVDPSE